jgi:hypothetical protein
VRRDQQGRLVDTGKQGVVDIGRVSQGGFLLRR